MGARLGEGVSSGGVAPAWVHARPGLLGLTPWASMDMETRKSRRLDCGMPGAGSLGHHDVQGNQPLSEVQ